MVKTTLINLNKGDIPPISHQLFDLEAHNLYITSNLLITLLQQLSFKQQKINYVVWK